MSRILIFKIQPRKFPTILKTQTELNIQVFIWTDQNRTQTVEHGIHFEESRTDKGVWVRVFQKMANAEIMRAVYMIRARRLESY